ncbi:unnamed protein product [Bursaphelenchus okinawaensis]|uniref:Abnormal cell migration protein 18-like fibronectin type I domain-containing protein n=1 Tax=Bursaphelenchus okinawaensis TaxID=465554 RepID=A0A811LBR2_9BILA|nr:unnamed protein product [Bursaphelenchus okinawaensis]CAG9120012.1 unnamed protein product [Bursaphelenchus okinawaensis]
MRCTINNDGSWKTEVVACLSPSGSRIPLNGKIIEDNSEWSCANNDQGKVALSQGPNPYATCGNHAVGSRWQEKSFELECRPGGVRELKACVTEDGQRIPVNGTKQVGGFTLVCQQYQNGTVVFHGSKSVKAPQNFSQDHAVKCIDEQSGQRDIGEHWIENHRFNKTCKENGAVEVVNCISKDGYSIPLNGQIIRNRTKYSCEMTSQGTIRYAAGPVE